MPFSWQVVASSFCLPFALYLLFLLTSRKKRVDIRGKVVLITGATSGLGEACARVFFRHGCRVILAGRSEERLMAVKASMVDEKVKAAHDCHEPAILTVDLEDLDSLPQKAKQALALFQGLDIIINNAGISYRGRIQDTAVAVDQKLMTVNYFGHVTFIKALLPALLSQNSGHIVGISSVQGKISIPYRSAYSASKHALQAFFDCLRAELSDTNVRVSLISPGYIRTNLSTNSVTGDGSQYGVMDKTTESGMAPEMVAEKILQAVTCYQEDLVLAPFVHRAAIVLRAVAPQTFFSLMAKRAKKQKKDYVKG